MAPNADTEQVVLVVDDEEDVADTYSLRLQADYETRVAYGGEEALDKIDDDVDAVLLDRRMPDIHGDDVLEEIRDRGYDCIVIMSTAVDPDLNILEMDFDDYLCKPIFRETLLETLEKHLETVESGEEADLDTFLSLISKIDVLEEELSHGELVQHEEYQDIKDRAESMAPALRERIGDFDSVVKTHREINRGS